MKNEDIKDIDEALSPWEVENQTRIEKIKKDLEKLKEDLARGPGYQSLDKEEPTRNNDEPTIQEPMMEAEEKLTKKEKEKEQLRIKKLTWKNQEKALKETDESYVVSENSGDENSPKMKKEDQAKIKKLTRKNEEDTTRNEELTRKAEEDQARIQELEKQALAKNKDLEKAVGDKNRIVELTRKDIVELTRKNEQLTRKIEEAQTRIDQLTRKAEEDQFEIFDKEIDRLVDRERIEELTRKTEEDQARIQELEKQAQARIDRLTLI